MPVDFSPSDELANDKVRVPPACGNPEFSKEHAYTAYPSVLARHVCGGIGGTLPRKTPNPLPGNFLQDAIS